MENRKDTKVFWLFQITLKYLKVIILIKKTKRYTHMNPMNL